jgi:hypothetical protein
MGIIDAIYASSDHCSLHLNGKTTDPGTCQTYQTRAPQKGVDFLIWSLSLDWYEANASILVACVMQILSSGEQYIGVVNAYHTGTEIRQGPIV